jgi:IS30 family transposase
MVARLTGEQLQLARRLRANGMSLRAIAKSVGCTAMNVSYTLRIAEGPGRLDPWLPRSGRLTIEEREEILLGLNRGESMRTIACRLGRAPSTISREVKANGDRENYRIWPAHQRARSCARRPKRAKFDDPELCAKVTLWLKEFWSPQEISHRLHLDFPTDPSMHVSHETIYQSLFVQGRGELRRELARCLRSGRTARRSHGTGKGISPTSGHIQDMVMISDRPSEADDRAVPGHWEGDLIIGAGHKSAVGTLVERSTRFVFLLHLDQDHTALTVEKAMRRAIDTLPRELMRSVTWDQGVEMSNHRSITIETGIPIYFCDPHSPWQRGSNENTNGLLRQYMPKGSDLSKFSADDLQRIQDSLNGRPRETLGFMTPLEKLAEHVALTR